MSTISNWATMDELIATVKLRMGDVTSNDHYKIMSVVVSVLQEFNTHYRQTKKAIEIDPQGKSFVYLPDDFVDYIKIGWVAPNGEIMTYTKNDRLIDVLTMICGEDTNWVDTQTADNCVNPNEVPAKPIITP